MGKSVGEGTPGGKEMDDLWEKWNRDAEGGNGSVQLSSCAYHSDEPLRAKIVFSNGFHDS